MLMNVLPKLEQVLKWVWKQINDHKESLILGAIIIKFADSR